LLLRGARLSKTTHSPRSLSKFTSPAQIEYLAFLGAIKNKQGLMHVRFEKKSAAEFRLFPTLAGGRLHLRLFTVLQLLGCSAHENKFSKILCAGQTGAVAPPFGRRPVLPTGVNEFSCVLGCPTLAATLRQAPGCPMQ
jgi:hypothetical protein